MLERKMVEADRVRQFPLFRNLSSDLLRQVQEQSRTTHFDADEPVFHQGEPARRSYFCLSGEMKLFRLTAHGGEKIFHIATAGESLFDSFSSASVCTYPLHCTTLTRSEALSMDTDFLTDLLHRSQPARSDLVDSLIDRMHGLIDHVELLSVDKASFRVASFLLDEFRRNGENPRFRLRASKKHIASFLSLQPETLSRCLKTFRSDGIARSSARDIEILDADRLQRMVSGIREAA